MISVQKIRELVSAYLSDSDDDKFAIGVGLLSGDVFQSRDKEAIDLMNEIEFKMTALHSGMISYVLFIEYLRQVVAQNAYTFSTNVYTATSASPFFNPHLAWGAAAGSWASQIACKQSA